MGLSHASLGSLAEDALCWDGSAHLQSQHLGSRAGEYLSFRPVWTTWGVSGQPGIYRKTLAQKTKQQPPTLCASKTVRSAIIK